MEVFNNDMILTVRGSRTAITVRYPIFKKYEDLILDASEGKYTLDVKLSPCECDELDCTMCRYNFRSNTWVEYLPKEMGAGVQPFEVLEFRKAYNDDDKYQAVDVLLGLGYTKEGEQWKPPIGKSPFKQIDNVAGYFSYVIRQEQDKDVHPEYAKAVAKDILEIIDTGKSHTQLCNEARSKTSE